MALPTRKERNLKYRSACRYPNLHVAGLRHVKFLGIQGTGDSFSSNCFRDDGSQLEFIDAVLEDINLNVTEDLGEVDIFPPELTPVDSPPSSGSARPVQQQDHEVPPTSLITLKPRVTKSALHIASIPYNGDLASNISSIEDQLRSILLSNRSPECEVCQSADVLQKKKLQDLTIWRLTLMSEIHYPGKGARTEANNKKNKTGLQR